LYVAHDPTSILSDVATEWPVAGWPTVRHFIIDVYFMRDFLRRRGLHLFPAKGLFLPNQAKKEKHK
jgi:hypothetical protein